MPPGQRQQLELPAALLPTHTQVHLPVTVQNGSRKGPHLWVSAAVHGDELNGVEIIRRVLDELLDVDLRGALLAVPIVNVFGFLHGSRYLPDRRDLNRCFPGSAKGSLASRIAHLFLTEIVDHCTHGIDLHTAATERSNHPQIRADLRDPETLRCARAFGAPAMLQAAVRAGSLRGAAVKRGIPVIVYEGGEPLRFDEPAISTGVRGVLDVMRALKMIAGRPTKRPSRRIEESKWIRARRGGILRLTVDEGTETAPGQEVGSISDPFGEERVALKAPFHGLVLGKTTNPVVHGGDAVLHVGKLD